ncbi:MAG TPA: VOC family protein [Longimicrobiaceae bacterium]|nr:VOC family protein [Longimicrobiaceae bacterium]
MSITHVGAASVWVHDLDGALDYYTRVLGLSLDRTLGEKPRPRMAWLRFPEGRAIIILSEARPGMGAERVGGFTGLVLDVDDAERTCRELEERGARFAAPLRADEDAFRAVVRDPDGNDLLLFQPRDEADRH